MRGVQVDDRWTLKVSDFGLSRFKAASVMTGQCGTYQWMAPEVIASQHYNEKADVYSYAINLWEMYTQQVPYQGMHPMQVAIAVMTKHKVCRRSPSFAAEMGASLVARRRIVAWDSQARSCECGSARVHRLVLTFFRFVCVWRALLVVRFRAHFLPLPFLQRPEIPADCPEGLAMLIRDCWSTIPDVRPTFSDVIQRLRAMSMY